MRNKINLVINKVNFRMAGLKFNDTWKINGRIYIINEGKIQIGNSFSANSGKNANPIGGDTMLRLIVRKNGNLKIGKHVGISNSTIVCKNEIEIGDFVLIGGGCKIWDTDFHSIGAMERMHKGDLKVKSTQISIGNYAFIGGSSTILKGVTIGNHSIVATGSVVTKNIPDNEIWGGNPARFIKTLKI